MAAAEDGVLVPHSNAGLYLAAVAADILAMLHKAEITQQPPGGPAVDDP